MDFLGQNLEQGETLEQTETLEQAENMPHLYAVMMTLAKMKKKKRNAIRQV